MRLVLNLTDDELRAIDRGLCLAAAVYRDDAAAAEHATVRKFSLKEEAECRRLMDKIGRFLADA